MDIDTKITETLRSLEQRLLDKDVRHSADKLDDLLADDFMEIGKSGRVFDKTTIIEALRAEPGGLGSLTVEQFQVQPLSDDLALATYKIAETNTRRSSIWRKANGRWRVFFHQGTPIATVSANKANS